MTRYILIMLSVLLIGLSACDEKYDYTYTGPIQVQFASTSADFFVLDEDNQSLDLKIQLVGEQQSTNIQMNMVVLDSALINGKWAYTTVDGVGRADITSLSATIPAGESFGYYEITSVYDSLTSGVVDTLIVQLSGGDVDVAGFNNVCMIKIQQYYPYIPSEYVGFWSGLVQGYQIGYSWQSTNPGLTIEQGDGNRLIVTSGFWQETIDNWGETWTDGPYPFEIYMNDEDPTNFVVEIPERQYLGTTNGLYVYHIEKYPEPGSFNSTAKSMYLFATMKVYLVGEDESSEGTVDYTYYYIKLGGLKKEVQKIEPPFRIPEGLYVK